MTCSTTHRCSRGASDDCPRWPADSRRIWRRRPTGAGTTEPATASEQLDVAMWPQGVLWPQSDTDICPPIDPAHASLVDDAESATEALPLLIVVWHAGQGAGAAHAQQHPVPFSEFVPDLELLRRLTPLVDTFGTDMAAGTAPTLMRVIGERLERDVPVVTGICFQGARRGLMREGALGRGDLIVNPAINASFGRNAKSTRQLAVSRPRATRHSRAAVELSTVGVSTLIMPDGTVLDRTQHFTFHQLTVTLPLRNTVPPCCARRGEVPLVSVRLRPRREAQVEPPETDSDRPGPIPAAAVHESPPPVTRGSAGVSPSDPGDP